MEPRGAAPAGMFQRLDESPDVEFYAVPRFVTHIDDGAIAAVTRLYRERLSAGAAVLDLMSSWVSHLPSGRTWHAGALRMALLRELWQTP